ncbi:MAG: ParA family protein [Burkholderiales bacterium]|nr:ParA family protein [Burkholderiales bacterium]
MTAFVIGLVQAKGGVGRSTVSTTLAAELARAHRVVLVDCDMPQGTALAWANLRRRLGRTERLTVETASGQRELTEKIHQHLHVADYIILDGPPRVGDLTKAILVLSDLALIPMGASAAELWATANLLLLIEEAREYRDVVGRIVWTRFRSQTRIAQELSEIAVSAIEFPALATTLGHRVAYAEALGQGRTAAELADEQARNEVAALVAEIEQLRR